MTRNLPVPIVNNAEEAVTFERQIAGNPNRGTITLKPGAIHHEPGINLTYETLVLKDSSGNFTDQSISTDVLADDSYEKIEVTRDFRLVKHKRKTRTQKFSDKISEWNPFTSRSRGDRLPK